jgi:hypothetical protein
VTARWYLVAPHGRTDWSSSERGSTPFSPAGAMPCSSWPTPDCAAPGRSPPCRRSLEPEFTRSHDNLYKALAKGRINDDRLRRLLVASRPRD